MRLNHLHQQWLSLVPNFDAVTPLSYDAYSEDVDNNKLFFLKSIWCCFDADDDNNDTSFNYNNNNYYDSNTVIIVNVYLLLAIIDANEEQDELTAGTAVKFPTGFMIVCYNYR